MYTFRLFSQGIVALYVFLSSAAAFGYIHMRPNDVLTVCALVATIWLVTNRTTWLPFLGPTVMPAGVLDVKTPKDADMTIALKAPADATKCVFWGSVIESDDPYEAYGGYTNAGVADVRADGIAVVSLRTPKKYSIFGGKRLQPHVHYRWVGPRGMLSPVKTATLSK